MLRAVGIASDGRNLILATLGLLALVAGWAGLGSAFGGPVLPFAAIEPGAAIEATPGLSSSGMASVVLLMTEPFRVVVMPFVVLFQRGGGALLLGPIRLDGGLVDCRLGDLWRGDHKNRGGPGGQRSSDRGAIGLAVLAGQGGLLDRCPFDADVRRGRIRRDLPGVGLIYRIPWGIGTTLAAFLGFVPLLFGVVIALSLATWWPDGH